MENSHLLISDVDGTLLGDDDALGEFATWWATRPRGLRLVYNSGRSVNSILQSVESTELPMPDAIIGSVGTDIRSFRGNDAIVGWPPDLRAWQPSRVLTILSNYPELQLQPAEYLSDFKISYYARNASPDLIAAIQQRLANSGCDVELIYSSNRDLDVLPPGVNKGTASAYLAQQWSVPADRVIVSGDTANDLAMFAEGFRGIVVGNALDELKSIDVPDVYQATRTHAAGVLEGLSHWLRDSSLPTSA